MGRKREEAAAYVAHSLGICLKTEKKNFSRNRLSLAQIRTEYLLNACQTRNRIPSPFYRSQRKVSTTFGSWSCRYWYLRSLCIRVLTFNTRAYPKVPGLSARTGNS